MELVSHISKVLELKRVQTFFLGKSSETLPNKYKCHETAIDFQNGRSQSCYDFRNHWVAFQQAIRAIAK